MIVFATPDFGSTGGIILVVLLIWTAALVVALAGVLWGATRLKSKSLIARRCGLWLMLASASAPLVCYFAPPIAIRVAYGNYPIGRYPDGKIKDGMSTGEVTSILGTPHERYKEDDGAAWYYWIDSFGINWFSVRFGSDGLVVDTHGS